MQATPCPLCGDRIFTDPATWSAHQAFHIQFPTYLPPGPFACELCSVNFGTRAELALHAQQYHPVEPASTFRCPACHETLSNNGNLERHCLTRHPGVPLFVCEACGQRFFKTAELRAHRKQHGHERGRHRATRFICNMCGEPFLSAAARNYHITVIHVGMRALTATEYVEPEPALDVDSELPEGVELDEWVDLLLWKPRVYPAVRTRVPTAAAAASSDSEDPSDDDVDPLAFLDALGLWTTKRDKPVQRR